MELNRFPTPGPCARKPAEKRCAGDHGEQAARHCFDSAQLSLTLSTSVHVQQNVGGQKLPEG